MKKNSKVIAFFCLVAMLATMLVMAPSTAAISSLENYIDVDDLRAAFFFDSNLDAAYADATATASGNVEYVNGYFGNAAYVSGGSYVKTSLTFDKESFSISLWINRNDIANDPVMYGNQNWSGSANTGFTFPMKTAGDNQSLAFSNKDAGVRIRMNTVFDAVNYDKWVHTLLVVDRENNVVKYYENFEYVTECSIAALEGLSLDSGYTFNVGRDGPGTYNRLSQFKFDDLLVFDHAVTADTITGLNNYYNQPLVAESISLNHRMAALNPGQGVALEAEIKPSTCANHAITWKSSNEEVAKVDENGVVTALTAGSAVITATVDEVSAECAVTVTAAPDRKIYDHVVFVGIDGCGDFLGADAPNINRIFAEGASTGDCLVTRPSISAQNWATALTGVSPNLHWRTNSNVETETYQNEKYPTFFKLVRETYPNYDLEAYCTWTPVTTGIIEDGINVLKGEVTGSGSYGKDAFVADAAVNAVTNNNPNLLLLHFNGADSAGHNYGYGGDNFKEQISTIDGYVGRIYDAIQNNPEMKDNTLFIVTGDHGGVGTGHGGWSDEEKYVFFGAVGDGVNKNDALDVRLIDTAAIVTYALNAKGNPTWDSYVPKNLFVDNMNSDYKQLIAEETTAVTPTSKDEKYIGNFVDAEKLESAVFFDGGENTDLFGNITPENIGTIYYTDGYYGHGAQLSGSGYISVDDLVIDKNSFSIGLWVNRNDLYEDPVLYGNQDWSSSANTGFTFPMRTAGANQAFAFSNKVAGVRIRMQTVYAAENYDQWVHTLLIVDRENNVVKYYENFEFVKEASIADLEGLSLNSGLPFTLGQSATGNYEKNIDAMVDDLLVYNCAVTEEDIADLQTYYSFRDCLAGNHNWGEYIYNNDETFTSDGTETATCQKDGCTATDTRVVEGTKIEFVLGDVDRNDALDSADVVMVLRYLNGTETELIDVIADANHDGKISLADALRILKMING